MNSIEKYYDESAKELASRPLLDFNFKTSRAERVRS